MVECLDMHFLAMVLEREFCDFQLVIAELRAWPTYDDFVMDREGYCIGMSWAGLDVFQVEIPYRAFMRWVDLTGSACSLRDLDEFAARRWLRARYPDWNPRLVCSKPTSLIADRSGQLYIPMGIATPEAGDRRVVTALAEAASNHVLAGVIARECLDPVG